MSRAPDGPAKQFTEEDKRYARNLHRQAIAQAREEANLCRRHYETQAEEGVVKKDLVADLAAKTFLYWDHLRAPVDSAGLKEQFSELDKLDKRTLSSEKHIADMDVPASKFVGFIEKMNTLVEDTGILEREEV
jgi:hypothetical protein